MAETIKPNMPLSKQAIKTSAYQRAKDALSWRERSPGEKFMASLREDVWEWSLRDDAMAFEEFCDEYGIPYDTFDDFVKKDEKLSWIYKQILRRLGTRRQAWLFKANPNQVLGTLRIYNKDWRQVYEEDKATKIEISKEQAKAKVDAEKNENKELVIRFGEKIGTKEELEEQIEGKKDAE